MSCAGSVAVGSESIKFYEPRLVVSVCFLVMTLTYLTSTTLSPSFQQMGGMPPSEQKQGMSELGSGRRREIGGKEKGKLPSDIKEMNK